MPLVSVHEHCIGYAPAGLYPTVGFTVRFITSEETSSSFSRTTTEKSNPFAVVSKMVNYIRHLESAFDKISTDERLTTCHTSLYYSLFHLWNLSKFQNPISICRSEVMKTSKIGSANTYTRCLKQLDEWGYIEYIPSHNPTKGSLVNLYNFDNSSDKTTDNSTDKSSEIVVRPSINNTNNKKHSKPNKQDSGKTKFRTPSLEEVKEFFLELKSSENEAENFHNYFESNGWLVGGKAKMKNWKAAARNWIKRSTNFTGSNRGSSGVESRLHSNNDKDYSIPL